MALAKSHGANNDSDILYKYLVNILSNVFMNLQLLFMNFFVFGYEIDH